MRSGHCCTTGWIAAAFLVAAAARAADDGTGDPLRLYSGWTDSPPTIDGDILSNPTEWRHAFVRRISLVDADGVRPETVPAYLMAMNDANNLYLAITYKGQNSGNPNNVSFYFDQGPGGTDRDSMLSANAETAIRVRGNGDTGEANVITSGYVYDGSAWTLVSSSNDPTPHPKLGRGMSYSSATNNIWTWEVRIPLDHLDVLAVANPGDGRRSGILLGLYVKVDLNEVGFNNFMLHGSNADPLNADGWHAIRLGAPRDLVTFGATKNVRGNPALDGDLSDDAYVGGYQRNMVLTNFIEPADNLDARVFMLQDTANQHVYIGLRVFDPNPLATDQIRIYQEQTNALGTSTRNIRLDDGWENALELSGDGTFVDRYFTNAAPNWPADPGGDTDDNAGAVSYNAELGAWEFEFRLDYQGGQYDFDVSDTALAGFQIRYLNDSNPDGRKNLWWDLTVNSDAVLLSEAATTYLAIGWAEIQLGAPYIHIMHPADGATVQGTYPLDVYVEPDAGVTVDSVRYQLAGPSITEWKSLVQTGTSFLWTADMETADLADGAYELRVRVTYAGSLTLTQIVNINVDNAGVGGSQPVVTVTEPAAGSVISDIATISFDITPESGETIVRTEVSVDGGSWSLVSNAPTAGGSWNDGYHLWNTTALPNGSHFFRVRAEDSSGRIGYSEPRLVVVSNGVTVELTSPEAGSAVSGSTAIEFTIDPEPTASIVLAEVSVDGGAWTAASTQPTTGGDWDDGSHTWDTLAIPNGSRTIQVRAQDSGGRIGYSRIISVSVSNHVSVTITSPSAGEVVKGLVDVLFDVDPEPGETIVVSEISVDGGPWTATTVQPTAGAEWDDGSHEWDTRSYANGSHSLQVRARDSGDRIGYSSVLLVSVQNDVIVTVTAPVPGEVVGGSTTIKFEVSVEAGESVDLAEVSIDGGAWVAASTQPTEIGGWADGSHEWGTSLAVDGSHVFSVRARDSNARYGYSQERLVLVDNTGPAITDVKVLYPFGDGVASAGDTVIISARVVDAIAGVNPATVELDSNELDGQVHLMVDDGTNGDAVAGDGVFTAKVVVKTTGNVEARFSISASDAIGNASAASDGVVWVRNNVLATGCAPSSGRTGASLVLVFGIAAVAIVMRRKALTVTALLGLALLVATPARAMHFLDGGDALRQAPLSVEGGDFLHNLILVPRMEGASVVGEGNHTLTFGVTHARESYLDVSGTSSVDTNATFQRHWARLVYGLSEKVELRATLSYSAWDGTLELIKDGQAVFENTGLGSGPSSPVVGVKYSLKPGTAALCLDAKLPTGDTLDYLATGSPDYALGLMLSKPGRTALHGAFSIAAPGRPSAFRPEAELEFQDFVWRVGLGMTISAGDSAAYVLQVEGGSNALEGDGLDELEPFGGSLWRAVIGARFVRGSSAFEVAIAPRISDPGSDWVLQASFTVGSF